MTYYLAIDIGASSGRHILGELENGKLTLREIYRFDNEMTPLGGSLTWDMDALTKNVIEGIRVCGQMGKIPATVAIDTFGVDYVLLDKSGREIKPTYAYRDARTENSIPQVEAIISREALYGRTGIAPLPFNTVYQLYCDKIAGRLEDAEHLLMIPDYLSYRLTGVMAQEYTNATTTSLVNAEEKQWDKQVISLLGYPEKLFMPLSLPGTPLGSFSEEIAREVGFDAVVVHAPSHDTAAAVAACPLSTDSVYISSGTWSLVGTENKAPILGTEALHSGFTNEGGVEYNFRFLENIMGMWLFQSIRRDLGKSLSYDEMMHLAQNSRYTRQIDPNDPAFLAPESMTEAIKAALGDRDLPLGDLLKSVYLSLAHSYDDAIRTIEKLSGKEIRNILIVGGGSRDGYLNRLTAEVTGKKVWTGLSEGTAVGNLAAQILFTENLSLTEVRRIIRNSFSIKEIES